MENEARCLPQSIRGSNSRSKLPILSISAAFLTKLAKHLAVIACLLIVGSATGRFAGGPLGIFFLVVLAAVAHAIGRALGRRTPIELALLSGRLKAGGTHFDGIGARGKPPMVSTATSSSSKVTKNAPKDRRQVSRRPDGGPP
jgi:hypothetical protein